MTKHRLYYLVPPEVRKDYADWMALSGETKDLDTLVFDSIVLFCSKAATRRRAGEIPVDPRMVRNGHPAAYSGKLVFTDKDLAHIEIKHEEVAPQPQGSMVQEFGDPTWELMELVYTEGCWANTQLNDLPQLTFEEFWKQLLDSVIFNTLAKYDVRVMEDDRKSIKAEKQEETHGESA